MVRDLPTTNGEFSYIEISRNNQQPIPIPTDYMDRNHGIEYCSKAGVLLVNMDCCTCIDNDTMENSAIPGSVITG